MSKTIAEFRKAGYKVHVNHIRNWRIAYVEPRNNKLVTKTVPNTAHVMNNDDGDNFVLFSLEPKGGRTEVIVTDPTSGIDIYADSTCHSEVNYDKKRGVETCLKRIVDLILVCSLKDDDGGDLHRLKEFVSV